MTRSRSWRVSAVGVALLSIVAALNAEGLWWPVVLVGAGAGFWGLGRLATLDTGPVAVAVQESTPPIGEPYESPLFDRLEEGIVVIGSDQKILFTNRAARSQLPGLAVSRAIPLDLVPTLTGFETDFNRGAKHFRAVTHDLEADRKLIVLTDRTREERYQAMRTDFVAAASHELKTPSAAIRVAAEALLLAFENDPVRAKRFAVHIEEQAERLAEIVSDLLDLSRLETRAFEPAICSLDMIVEREVENARPASGVQILSELQDIRIMGSASDLTLAVRNLIDNACRYTDSGTITVRLEQAEDAAVLSVADTGIGIPGRSRDRVFERFYRADKARDRATGGTGLGLAIVKHVAEIHGGSVEVESELGIGSTFSLKLPVA